MTDNTELVLDVTLPLPPDRAFALWSNAEHLARWWGPRDDAGRPFRAEAVDWKPEVGASWRAVLVAPNGDRFAQGGRFIAVTPNSALAFTFAWEDADGQLGHETRVEVGFLSIERGTRIHFRQTGFEDQDARDGHVEGWRGCLDRLREEASQ
jgi:uncharacterized protein YndB with AHSA1/START domain